MIESFKLPTITPETISGAICSFNDEYGNLPLKSCTSLISGYQEGSGIPSPQNERPLHAFSSGSLGKCDNNTASLWTIDNNFNGDVEFNQLSNNSKAPTSRSGLTITGSSDGFTIDGTATADITATGWFNLDKIDDEYLSMAGHKVIISLKLLSGTITKAEGATRSLYFGLGGNVGNVYIDRAGYILVSPAITSSSTSSLTIINGTKFENAKIGLNVIDLTQMFPSTIADYIYNLEQTEAGVGVAFFKSLYPNSYYPYNTGTKQLVGDTLATFTFGQDIYQGYIDWKRGIVTATWGYIASYNGETLTGEWLCNKAPYEAGTTPPTGSQVAYELATPIEIPLGGINLLTQEGQNNIYADCGDTEVKRLKVN